MHHISFAAEPETLPLIPSGPVVEEPEVEPHRVQQSPEQFITLNYIAKMVVKDKSKLFLCHRISFKKDIAVSLFLKS